MKIVFMGTPEFAVPCLEMLLNEHFEIIGVFTQPDKLSNRGYKINYSPVKKIALENNLLLFQYHKLKNIEIKLKKLKPDLIVVVAFRILSSEILNLPLLGCINVHASLLPKYRGSAPINWAIINGEKETGVSTIFLKNEIDAGDIILQEKIFIEENETAEDIYDKLKKMASMILLKTIKKIESGKVERIIQKPVESFYASKLKRENGLIDWNKDVVSIYNLIRGLFPWPGTYTFLNGKRLKILKAEIYNKEIFLGKIGEIIKIEKKGIVVNTLNGLILLKEVQMENAKKMLAYDFAQGVHLKAGNLLA
ncbi:MAG: methionyl-tRNA formyltransferase [bacterium]